MQFGLASEYETIALEELNNDEVEVVSGGSGGGSWGLGPVGGGFPGGFPGGPSFPGGPPSPGIPGPTPGCPHFYGRGRGSSCAYG